MTRTTTETVEDRLLFDYEPEPKLDTARQHLEVPREQRATDLTPEIAAAWGLSDNAAEAFAGAYLQADLERQGFPDAGRFVRAHPHLAGLMLAPDTDEALVNAAVLDAVAQWRRTN